MIIAVAGPYSATSSAERKKNLDRLNSTAARLLEMGHLPLIGMNAALPVIKQAKLKDAYKATMDLSLALVDACEALFLVAESPGANRERDLVLSKGLPVYYSLSEVPAGVDTY